MSNPTDAKEVVERLRERIANAPTPHHWHHVDLSDAASLIEAHAADLARAELERDASQANEAEAIDLMNQYQARATTAEQENAKLRARVAEMEVAIGWALGEGDSDFGDNKPDNAKPFWWRAELRARSTLGGTHGG